MERHCDVIGIEPKRFIWLIPLNSNYDFRHDVPFGGSPSNGDVQPPLGHPDLSVAAVGWNWC